MYICPTYYSSNVFKSVNKNNDSSCGAKIITEYRNQNTKDIDILSTIEMIQKINDEDKKVALAVEKEIPNIAKAVDIINEGRVLVNYISEIKPNKKILINDIITIRGKGKFIFDGIEKETKSERLLLNIRKYK